jgi:thiamine-phosphate pyrophosphorylase
MTLDRRRPIVMLVTSRARLAACAGLRPDDLERVIPLLVSQVEMAATAGVRLIQLREPDLDTRTLMRVARSVRRVVDGASTKLVVNGRPDVALAAGLDGVHLPEQGLPDDRVRTLLPPPAIVGRSVHRSTTGLNAGAIDYAVFGTVFGTTSKSPGHPLAGIEGLRRAVEGASVPVLAIGGITLEHLGDIAATGAAGFAAIGLFVPPSGSSSVTKFRKILESAQEAFDTVKDVS